MILDAHKRFSMGTTAQETSIIEKMTRFLKVAERATDKGYIKAKWPEMASFRGSSLKIQHHAENDSRRTEEIPYGNNGSKKINYSKKDKIFKSGRNGHLAKAVLRPNGQNVLVKK